MIFYNIYKMLIIYLLLQKIKDKILQNIKF